MKKTERKGQNRESGKTNKRFRSKKHRWTDYPRASVIIGYRRSKKSVSTEDTRRIELKAGKPVWREHTQKCQGKQRCGREGSKLEENLEKRTRKLSRRWLGRELCCRTNTRTRGFSQTHRSRKLGICWKN